MQFFRCCTTLDEVKATYRQLAKDFHPDRGGDTATMQEINKQYAFVCAKIAAGSSFTASEAEASILESEAYRAAIEAIINCGGLIIEVVGSWIWVTGTTRTHKDVLKSAGYYFASKKCAWYFRTNEHKTKGGKLTLDQIRNKYGSQSVNTYRGQYSLK